MKTCITLKVNGEIRKIWAEPWRTLVEVLKNDLELTGTKESCSTGECGSCTVLIDGIAVNSCLVLAKEVQEREILTIEGLANGVDNHMIQNAFIEHGAIQCGFCTSGMILSAKALLDKKPSPSETEVKSAISGNLCRCTGYVKIIEAILAASGDPAREGVK